jgi:hypothetical protein
MKVHTAGIEPTSRKKKTRGSQELNKFAIFYSMADIKMCLWGDNILS